MRYVLSDSIREVTLKFRKASRVLSEAAMAAAATFQSKFLDQRLLEMDGLDGDDEAVS